MLFWDKNEVSVQLSHSVVSNSLQPHGLQHANFPVRHQLLELLKLMSIKSVMPSSHLILCRPLLLLPSIFPSIRVFSNESVLPIRLPKYWSFSFSISPSNEYSRLISFRSDWLDLLAVQGAFKSFLHLSKMVRAGRWEGGSGWGTRVHLWQIHVDVWQNQYNIVK